MRLLSSLNGWQRLWLVITVCFVAYGALFQPFKDCASNEGEHTSGYRDDLKRDLENPDCQAYRTEALSQLKEPTYSNYSDFLIGTCWHLYNSRMAYSHVYDDIVPYTLAAFDNRLSQQWTWCLRTSALLWGLIAVILAGLLYGAGAIIAWIRGGFKAA